MVMAFVSDFEGREQKFSHRYLNKNTSGGFCSSKSVLLVKLATKIKLSSWKSEYYNTVELYR